MMKVPVILVVCSLLFSSPEVLAQRSSSVGPAECCFKFYTKRLPKNNVVTYQNTHIHCTTRATVFTMKNGAKLCVDLAQKWVQNIISYVESRPGTCRDCQRGKG